MCIRDRPGAGLEVADRLIHDTAVDAPGLIRVADEQAVVADRVDHARDAVGVLDDLLDRVLGEDAEIAGARHAQTRPDVVPGGGAAHRRDGADDRDPLLELCLLYTSPS